MLRAPLFEAMPSRFFLGGKERSVCSASRAVSPPVFRVLFVGVGVALLQVDMAVQAVETTHVHGRSLALVIYCFCGCLR